MDAKTMDVSSNVGRFVDKAAKTAHEKIEHMHGRVGSIEDRVGGKVEATTERVVAKFEERAKALGDYIEANPVMSTVIAFGIGMWASRMFRGMEILSPGPGATATTDKASEAKVGKAA